MARQASWECTLGFTPNAPVCEFNTSKPRFSRKPVSSARASPRSKQVELRKIRGLAIIPPVEFIGPAPAVMRKYGKGLDWVQRRRQRVAARQAAFPSRRQIPIPSDIRSARGGVGLVSDRPSMAADGAAIKAGGPSNLLRKSVPPPPLARRHRRPPAAQAAPPDAA